VLLVVLVMALLRLSSAFLDRWKTGHRGVIKYWKEDTPIDFPLRKKAAIDSRRYVTFEDDTGGWNNIRMAFEVFVVVAKTTGRILVLPPRCRFYLLDRGPISAFDKKKAKESTSGYEDFYDFEVLKKHIQVTSTKEFLEREAEVLGIPSRLVEEASRPNLVSNGHHTDYFLWLRECKDAIIWPSGPRVTEDFNLFNKKEIHPEMKILHFPMHVSKNLRFFNGVPALLSRNPEFSEANRAIKRFVRDSLVYSPRIFEAAEAYIELLGGKNLFSALHIRRNELQYKNSFVSGETSAAHVKPLQKYSNEKVFLATDETEKGFFDAFQQNGIMVLRMHDLRPQVERLVGKLHPKFEGMVEQLICAAGRVFAGTPMSTFSAHIFRLRGYIHARDADSAARTCFHHTENWVEQTLGICRSSFQGEADMGRGL